jgi:hypothetical protein
MKEQEYRRISILLKNTEFMIRRKIFTRALLHGKWLMPFSSASFTGRERGVAWLHFPVLTFGILRVPHQTPFASALFLTAAIDTSKIWRCRWDGRQTHRLKML